MSLGTAPVWHPVHGISGAPKTVETTREYVETENILKNIQSRKRFCRQEKVIAKRIIEIQTHLPASFYHCTGSAPLGLTRLCGSAPLCFWKKKHASLPTKQEREEQNRETKPVLDVQCTKREKKEKNKEISNEETKESAGEKKLQKTTGNINSARKDLSSSCFIAYFVSERAERACQGCRWRFTVTTWSRGKSGIFLWVTG